MDDQFLHDFHENPRPDFVEKLRQRLNEGAAARTPALNGVRWRTPALATLGVAAAFLVLLSFPSLRVTAQQFLDLFRVQHFVAISVDQARLEQISRLRNGTLDFKALLSRSVQVLREPGKPQVVDSPIAAGQIAGIDVSLPTTLPKGVTQEAIRVQGEGDVRFTADTALLQDVLDALQIDDVQIPSQLNGAIVTVRMPPIVETRYGQDGSPAVSLIQAASPEVTLPPGVYLPELAEICLRVAGIPAIEARQFAYSVDWRSTLLVPVPSGAASFREVEVNGTKALLIEARGQRRPTRNRQHPDWGSTLLWSEGGKIYCLCGTIRNADLIQMASSVQ